MAAAGCRALGGDGSCGRPVLVMRGQRLLRRGSGGERGAGSGDASQPDLLGAGIEPAGGRGLDQGELSFHGVQYPQGV